MGEHVKAGFGARVLPVNTYLDGVSMTYGILRGADRVLKHCAKDGLPYIYVDHSYFFKCRGAVDDNTGSAFFRFPSNNRYYNDIGGVPHDRLEKLKLSILPWNRKGSKVVVVPASRYVASFMGFDAQGWLNDTVRQVAEHTDRTVVMKPKSVGGIEGLDSLFEDAWAFVCHDSLSAISALMAGVPCFTTSDNPASPLSLQDLSKIETPWYPPNREDHFASLAWQQFTIAEIRSGYAKEVIEWRI